MANKTANKPSGNRRFDSDPRLHVLRRAHQGVRKVGMATVSETVSKKAIFLLLAHYSLTPVSRTGASFMITKGNIMKQCYILFRRSGVFYYEDTTTGKQLSLRTKDEAEARTLLNAKNESFRQPVLKFLSVRLTCN